MSVQVAFPQHHRQVLIECDVLQEVKHSLYNWRMELVGDLNEGGIDMPSLLEQGLVPPVRVQPSQLPRHPIVLPGVILLWSSQSDLIIITGDLIIMVWMRQRTVCSFTLGSPVRKQNTSWQTSSIIKSIRKSRISTRAVASSEAEGSASSFKSKCDKTDLARSDASRIWVFQGERQQILFQANENFLQLENQVKQLLLKDEKWKVIELSSKSKTLLNFYQNHSNPDSTEILFVHLEPHVGEDRKGSHKTTFEQPAVEIDWCPF